MLKRFVDICDGIAEWSGRIFCLGEYGILVIMLLQVFARYILKAPAYWTSDISLYIFGAIGVMSGAYLLKNHEHIKVDLIYSMYPKRARAFVDCLIYAIVAAWCINLMRFGIPYAIETFRSGERSISALHAPLWPIRSMIPLAAALQLIEAVALFIRSLYFFIRGEEL